MKILYLSQANIELASQGIYSDLINHLLENNHSVTLVRSGHDIVNECNIISDKLKIISVRVGQQFGVNFVKKGLVLLSLQGKILKQIKRHLAKDKYDLVLYATPPITLANVVKYCKRKFGCKSYLMLKDIFPQNAVDIGLMSKRGVSGALYKLFRNMEKKLYIHSDMIGCMSEANISYLLEHNTYLDANKIEMFPNSLKKIREVAKDKQVLIELGIDIKKPTFIYGGNLGRPQGLDFLAKALNATADMEYNFVLCGTGQDKQALFDAVSTLKNVYTYENMPSEKYIQLCASCDIGVIMLDYRFTIPNCPSRTLSYLESAMPIFACTDRASDINELVENLASCGKWCYSNDIDEFRKAIQWFIDNKESWITLGKNGQNYLKQNFMTDISVKKLENFIEK